MLPGMLILSLVIASASLASVAATNPCITSFNLVDTAKDPDVVSTTALADGGTIDLTKFGNCEINIVAKSDSKACAAQKITCVKTQLGGHTKNVVNAPYSVYGYENPVKYGAGPVYYSATPPLGTQTLKACTYTNAYCSKPTNAVECKAIKVNVKGGGVIKKFQFLDSNGKYIGDVNPTNCLPKGVINIEAVGDSCVDTVDLFFSGGGKNVANTDTTAPFKLYLYGGVSDLKKNTVYTITAKPTAYNNIAGTTKTQTFTFTSDCK